MVVNCNWSWSRWTLLLKQIASVSKWKSITGKQLRVGPSLFLPLPLVKQPSIFLICQQKVTNETVWTPKCKARVWLWTWGCLLLCNDDHYVSPAYIFAPFSVPLTILSHFLAFIQHYVSNEGSSSPFRGLFTRNQSLWICTFNKLGDYLL